MVCASAPLELSSVVLNPFKLNYFWTEFVENVANTPTNQEAARCFHALDCEFLFDKFKKGEDLGPDIPQGICFLSRLVFDCTSDTKGFLALHCTNEQIEEIEEDLFCYIFDMIGAYFEDFQFS